MAELSSPSLWELSLLGTVPLDAALRESADTGEPLVWSQPDAPASRAIVEIAEAVLARSASRASGSRKRCRFSRSASALGER